MRLLINLRTIFVVIAIFGISSCADQYPWEGLVYPKTGQMPYDIAIGHFATLEECRAAAIAVLSKTHAEEGAAPDYECGLNCRVSDNPPPPGQLALRTCEETSK
ncbi:MAG: hypothetical protein K8Q92_00130 [Methylophilales bacterium]|nr:hypothetical protein [Methylophilales bacterium]